ncbi:hypothetical protein LCGC14_1906970 [marine sediment metagenome]|uniref:YvrJ family protein n=1 Tax=marine sediment metagenome TaxID=412755 RepID=A0A0F9FV97_9ZZZZ
MDVEIVERLISSVGFPVVVTGYLLWSRDRILKELRDAVRELTIYLRQKNGG